MNHQSVKYLNDIDANVYNKNNEIFQQELWRIKTIEQKEIVEGEIADEQKKIVAAQRAVARERAAAEEAVERAAAARAQLEQIVSRAERAEKRARR